MTFSLVGFLSRFFCDDLGGFGGDVEGLGWEGDCDSALVQGFFAGFGEYFDKSKNQYFFNETQDSYSIDTFLRFLNDLNE